MACEATILVCGCHLSGYALVMIQEQGAFKLWPNSYLIADGDEK